MSKFPELSEQSRLADLYGRLARVDQVATVRHGDLTFPLLTFCLGSKDPKAPVLGIFGGVHGLERIGSQVVLAQMHSLMERLAWDETLQWQLERIRIILMPLVNPVGMKKSWRSNGNGVDLMRNAPVTADEGASPGVGGHRISPKLPWYMGPQGGPMETESQALCDFVRREAFQSDKVILVDCHSGFGVFDQLWFPYARSRKPYPELPETYALKRLFDRIYPHNVYRFEPQAKNYTTHGDLWDYLYDERRGIDPVPSRDEPESPKSARSGHVFLPLTLEMGSWNWVKKNPLQLFSYLGAFNPIKPHRQKRILRRHLPLFDFLVRAVLSPGGWLPADARERRVYEQAALKLWY